MEFYSFIAQKNEVNERVRERERENIDKAVGVETWCCIVSFGAGLYLMAGLGLTELN